MSDDDVLDQSSQGESSSVDIADLLEIAKFIASVISFPVGQFGVIFHAGTSAVMTNEP